MINNLTLGEILQLMNVSRRVKKLTENYYLHFNDCFDSVKKSTVVFNENSLAVDIYFYLMQQPIEILKYVHFDNPIVNCF